MSLQSEFTTGIFDPNAPLPAGVVDPDGQECPKRYSVYRNNVVHSLVNALSEAYPAILKDVGDEFFSAMAGLYVRQHPPQSPLMMFYGTEFSSFLKDFKPVSSREYLVDLAKLESSMRIVYHASDDDALDPAGLASLESTALMSARFEFRASSHLLQSPFPVLSVWQYQMQGKTMPEPSGPESILLTRPDLDVQITRLTPVEFTFLGQINCGASMGEAFDSAQSKQHDFDLSAALGKAFQSSCFSTILLGD